MATLLVLVAACLPTTGGSRISDGDVLGLDELVGADVPQLLDAEEGGRGRPPGRPQAAGGRRPPLKW